MKLKKDRTFGVHKVVPAKQTSNLGQGSRFVQCPLCGANLAWHTINTHLDTAHASVNDSTCGRPASGASDGSNCTQTSGSDPVRGNMQPRGAQQEHTTTDSESQPKHKHQQPWWQTGGPSNQSLASAKLITNTRQATPLKDDELRSLTPCEVVRDALPAKLADTLLKGLMSDAATWNRGTWYMGGKEHTAPRTSAYYTLHDTEEAKSVHAHDDNAKDVSSSVDTQKAAPELKEAASVVSDHVNRLAGRVQSSLASSDRDGWRCSYALCNMYQDGQEGVGPHADRLTMLGPRPIIASLSLGATRIFRISADVQLPHNTLVIMWPPMQEAWKHEVPKCKHVERHFIAGKARINLTFRRLKPEWAGKSPCCRCNQQAVLKASLPSSATSQQRYYFACDNTKGPGCGFFSWAQIAET
ncbi:hypothetical protein WJX82_002462 [Trebouxia sp. C0006]